MTIPHIHHTYSLCNLDYWSGTHVAKCGAMYGIRKSDTIFVSDLGHSNAQENANNRVS